MIVRPMNKNEANRLISKLKRENPDRKFRMVSNATVNGRGAAFIFETKVERTNKGRVDTEREYVWNPSAGFRNNPWVRC